MCRGLASQERLHRRFTIYARAIEIHNVPFGSYGQFTDKYGVSWIFKGEKKE